MPLYGCQWACTADAGVWECGRPELLQTTHWNSDPPGSRPGPSFSPRCDACGGLPEGRGFSPAEIAAPTLCSSYAPRSPRRPVLSEMKEGFPHFSVSRPTILSFLFNNTLVSPRLSRNPCSFGHKVVSIVVHFVNLAFVFIHIVGSIFIFNISLDQRPVSDLEKHIREPPQRAQAGTFHSLPGTSRFRCSEPSGWCDSRVINRSGRTSGRALFGLVSTLVDYATRRGCVNRC